MATFDAIVIGAGANGLTAAATLARAGLRVQVVERGDTLAGQASAIEFAPGHHAAPLGLDAGWVSPGVVRELGLAGMLRGERVEPEVPLSVALGGGEFLPLPRDAARAADVIRRHSASDAAKWPAFVARLRTLAGFLEALYGRLAPDVEVEALGEAWPLLALARKLRGLGRQGMTELLRTVPMPVADLADEWFESEPLRAALAACGVYGDRHGPRAGGTGFVLLHWLVGAPEGAVRGRGVWRDGPDAFVRAAESAARRHGTSIRTGAPVARILVRDDAVAGVVLEDGEEIGARLVLSAADPKRTLLGLVDPVWLDPELLHAAGNIRMRGCTTFVLYALDALPEAGGPDRATELLRGVVSLTPDVDLLERAADAAKYGQVPRRPHIEITVPTLHWPALAPPGRHVLVARVHYTPYRLRAPADGDADRAHDIADAATRAIDEVLPGFAARVTAQATLTPADLEQRFGLTEGAATHGELGLDQILFMRPLAGYSRYAMPIEGLYLCGAGAHPGPGVPGGPGWLAAQRALADRRAR